MQDAATELRPDLKKILLLNSSKILAFIVVVSGLIFLMKLFIDFNVFKQVASELGLELDFNSLMVPAILFGGMIALTFLFLSYINLRKVKYMFYSDRLETGKLTIPYNNIVKLTFEKVPVLNTGNITIELSGLEKKSTELKFIDDTQKVAADIQNLINQHKSRYYAEKSEEYKYDKILNREGF